MLEVRRSVPASRSGAYPAESLGGARAVSFTIFYLAYVP